MCVIELCEHPGIGIPKTVDDHLGALTNGLNASNEYTEKEVERLELGSMYYLVQITHKPVLQGGLDNHHFEHLW